MWIIDGWKIKRAKGRWMEQTIRGLLKTTALISYNIVHAKTMKIINEAAPRLPEKGRGAALAAELKKGWGKE